MKKLYLSIVLVFLGIKIVSAHPLDISHTTLTLHEKSLSVTTQLHSFEAQFLATEIQEESVYDFQKVYESEEAFFQYLEKHVKIKNNQKDCVFDKKEMPVWDDYVIFSKGYELHYTFTCDEVLENLAVENDLFIESFPLQTNKMNFYKFEGTNFQLKKNRVLNNKFTSFAWNVNEKTDLTIADTDQDGLSDDDERMYQTDPKNKDTDGDNYTDYEEILFSWNPLNSEMGPGQAQRSSLVEEVQDRAPQSSWFSQMLEGVFIWILELVE